MLKGDPEVALAGGGSASASAAAPEGPTTQSRSTQNTKSGGNKSVAKYSFKNGKYEDASYHSHKERLTIWLTYFIIGRILTDNNKECNGTNMRGY